MYWSGKDWGATQTGLLLLGRAEFNVTQVGYMGPRTDVVWADVHIADLVDLYILVLDGLLAANIDQGSEGTVLLT